MSNVLFNLANVTLTECETRVDLHNPSDTDGTKRSARTLEARKRYRYSAYSYTAHSHSAHTLGRYPQPTRSQGGHVDRARQALELANATRGCE